MGASQSSQPPSRQPSRHGKQSSQQQPQQIDTKSPAQQQTGPADHKQKAPSTSTPMKPSSTTPTTTPAMAIANQPPSTQQSSSNAQVTNRPTEVQSVPIPAVAMPIPVRRKPASLPASGESSNTTEERRNTELSQRTEKLDIREEEEDQDSDSDDEGEQSKFGIAWVASDDFEEEERPRGLKKFPLTITWRGPAREVYLLGTFTERRALRMRRHGNEFRITVDAEPGGHRFRFEVDGDRRTSPDYPLATDHQNVVVNYIDHMKELLEPEEDYEAYQPEEIGPPKERWTTEVPAYIRYRRDRTPSPLGSSAHSHSSQSSTSSRHSLMPHTPAQMKRHILNIQPISRTEEKIEDNSVIGEPSHAILGHIAIKNYANDNILATAVTTRYKEKFVTTVLYRAIDDE